MTNANDNETVQERIYRIMRSKKMQQSLVAKDAGFAPKDFNNMLKGRKLIRPEHIVPLCRALGVSADVLFGFPPNATQK